MNDTLTPQDAPVDAPETDVEKALPAGYDWAMRGLAGNITTTPGKAIAWYVRNPVRWGYRTVKQQDRLIDSVVRAYVTLSGRRVHERTSPQPFPIAAALRNLDLDTPNPVNQAGWENYLNVKGETLRNRSIGQSMSFLGVELSNRSWLSKLTDLRHAFDLTPHDIELREVERLLAEADIIGQGLGAFARPATQRELEWLVWRSRALCLPVPNANVGAGTEPLDATGLASIYDSVVLDPDGSDNVFGRTLRIVGTAAGYDAPVERHVAILSIGRMEAQHIPGGHTPWMALPLQTPGVELSSHVRVLSGADSAKMLQKKINSIVEQIRQWGTTSEPGPVALPRLYAQARHLQDVAQEGHPEDATSVDGFYRLAIPGRTAKDADKRARDLIKKLSDQRITAERPPAIEELYREFTPGEHVRITVNRRRGPIRIHAAGLPQITGTVGHDSGFHVGDTVGISKTPFLWDLHRGMEQEDQSGLTPIVGGLGAGKSYLMGGLSALSILANTMTTVLDPSARLSAIARWSSIADRTAVLNLLETEQGPYGVIGNPTLDLCRQDPDVLLLPIDAQLDAAKKLLHEREINANLERRALAQDVLLAMLRPKMREDPRTEAAILAAVNEVGGRYTASLRSVLAKIGEAGKTDDYVRTLWLTLNDLAEHPRGRVMMGAQRPDSRDYSSVTGLIVTLAGVVLPDTRIEQGSWSTEERLAVPLLNIAAHYVSRRVFSLPPSMRKLVGLDEAHFFAPWPSGRALLSNLERNSRKNDTRVLTASQDARTALQSQDASKALTSDAIMLHTEDETEQAYGAKLLRIPEGFGAEAGRLRPAGDENRKEDDKWRDALVRISGQNARVRLNGFHDLPELRRLLLTSPKPAGRTRELVDAVNPKEW